MGCQPQEHWLRAPRQHLHGELSGSGIYAAACVVPKARRISGPLFSAGTSLFFKSMVTRF